jgi:hypothetical protein
MATSYTSNKKIGALDSASTPLAAANEIVINQNGDILKTPLSAVEAKVFDAKSALNPVVGSEVVVVRQTDNILRQVALDNIVKPLLITDAMVNASAGIVDTKLATINTAGKVTNNAVQAVSTNTANRIVTRDGSGNFEAGTITAALSGNATTATTASQTAATLTRGTYLTGNNFTGAAATTWAVDADTANTANKVVARSATGNFSAGTITASLTGNVTGNSDTATNLSSNRTFALTGEVTGSVASNLSTGASIATTITSGSITTTKLAPIAFNIQTGSYVVTAADAGMVILMNSAVANTVSLPAGLPIGTQVTVIQIGTGATSFAATGGTVLRTTDSFTKLYKQWSVATAIYVSTNNWVLAGDIIA